MKRAPAFFSSASRLRRGFTLVEILVTMAIMTILLAGILQAATQIGKSFKKTQKLVTTRSEISALTQTLYSFANRAFRVRFVDGAGISLNYFTGFDPLATTLNTNLDVLYFAKSSAAVPPEGRLFYDAGSAAIRWFKDNSTANDILLRDVYRTDAQWDSSGSLISAGVQPVFRFPHQQGSLWQTYGTFPKFVIVSFRKQISRPTSQNPKPVTVPITLMLQVGTMPN